MKRDYISPEILLIQIITEDILTGSSAPALTLIEGDGSGDGFEFPI